MKKLLYVLLVVVLTSVNLFGYFFVSTKHALDFLYSNKQVVYIDYAKAERSFEQAEFINALVKFSEDNHVNISQYYFMSENDVNIYSTNIKDDSDVNLKSGELPKGNQYISSKKEDQNKNYAKQTGVISFPLSSWGVRIYDVQQFTNVGLRNEFYISGGNAADIMNVFTEQFSSYGEISLVSQKISSLVLVNMTLLMVVVFSFVIFCIGLFYFIIKNRKIIVLGKLWGYSNWRMLFYMPRMFLRFFTLAASLLLLGMLLFVVLFEQTYFLRDYFIMYVTFNGAALSALLLLMLAGTWMIQSSNDSAGIVKGKLPFDKVQWISAILKTIVSVILFSIVCSSFANFSYLSSKAESLNYWNQTQNVFRIQVGPVRKYIRSNVVTDREFNDRLYDFYKKIELNNKAFLMMSENFQVIGHDNGQPVYSYTLNTTGEEEMYSPSGRGVIINKNYLEINPIYDSNGIVIEGQLQINADTLNLLVPEQFAELEQEIINAYTESFYFHKVFINNMYNEALGQALNEKNAEDLTINIIYTRQGQEYFTFNSYTGDSHNKIKDPIAQLYNDSVDTSSIGAYTTTSLFFIDHSQGSAFERIYPSIMEAGAHEINNAISVYNEANDQIIQLQWLLFNQIIALIITVIFSVVLLISFIWAYYYSNIYQLNLKNLFGYSYWKINKEVIATMVISYILSGVLVYFIYGTITVVLTACFVFIIDLMIINRLNSHLNSKNVNKVLKGERL